MHPHPMFNWKAISQDHAPHVFPATCLLACGGGVRVSSSEARGILSQGRPPPPGIRTRGREGKGQLGTPDPAMG